MPAPATCPGNQPEALTVTQNNESWVVNGGGDDCYWTDDEGNVELYLDEEGRKWFVSISSQSSEGTLDTTAVTGTYTNGAVVATP
ncbi:MAG: hypothetical protein WD042_11635 [Phycisphaeraceae bacterium]